MPPLSQQPSVWHATVNVRKAGMRCVWLEVRKSEIAGLVRAGLLDKNESNDLRALKAALYRHLEETLDPLPSSRAGA